MNERHLEVRRHELAGELHLAAQSAAGQMDCAGAVTGWLPRCLAALRDGRMHPVYLRIIEEETRVLAEAPVPVLRVARAAPAVGPVQIPGRAWLLW